MPQTLHPTNFDSINIIEKSELSADVASGQKIANVNNSQNIASDDFILIGNLGSDTSDFSQIDSKSNNELTVKVNFSNAHKRGDLINKLFGDKIQIYRASNIDGSVPADSSFSLLNTIDIDFDQLYTEYTDSNGNENFWYKKVYYNSANLSSTDLASSQAIRGGNFGNYATVQEVKEEAGLTNNPWIAANVYQEKLLAAQGEVNASLKIGGYSLPLQSVPEIVKTATILIAAGYVLLKDYGVDNTGTTKDGNSKLTEGRKLLQKIEAGGEILVDESGNSISKSNRIGGYPDNTAEDEIPSEARQFHITDIY